MKSLAGTTNRFLLTAVVMLILSILMVLAFTTAILRVESSSEQYRQSVSLVNSIISELNRIRSSEPEERVYEALEERIETLLRSEAVMAGGKALSGELETLPDRIREGSISFSQAVQEAGAIARILSGTFYGRRKLLNALAAASILLNLIVIALLLALTLLLRKTTGNFYAQIRAGLASMRKVLDYDLDRGGLPPPRWEEEELLQETIAKLTGQIERDQELREMELHNNLETLLPLIRPLMLSKVPCDRLSVAFLDTHGVIVAESAVSTLPRVVLEPGFTEHISKTSLQAVIQGREPRIINDLEGHYDEVNRSVSTEKLLKEGIRSSITVPLFFENRCVGFFFVSSAEKNAYDEHHAFFVRKIAYSIKQHIYYTFVLQQVIAETASAFVKLTEKKDNETSLHIQRMAQYSNVIARKLHDSGPYEVRPRFMREILWFAPLHDIGKIGIPDSILMKPGRLDPAEWSVMETHVTIGEEVLRSMDRGLRKTMDSSLLQTAIDIISGHHEKWNGSGYPRGLQGEEIPLAGRIVAIADVFDALTSKRPYKEAFPIDRALEIIRSGAGTHFDPAVAEAFEKALPEITRIYESHKEV